MHRFMIFFIILTLLFLLMDYYFLKKWTAFVKRKDWHRSVFIAPWIFAGLMLLFSIVSSGIRLTGAFIGPMENIWSVMMTLWYLPKLIIVPVMGIRDIIRKLQNRSSRSLQKEQIVPAVEGRRGFLQTAAWGVAGAPFLITANGTFRTRYDFTVYYAEVFINNLPQELDGIRIAQLSDIHAGSFLSGRPVKNACLIIEELRPDIIAVTGDFVNFHPDEMKPLITELKKLPSQFGAYGCLGNHDHYMSDDELERLKSIIADSGIDLLVNENRTLKIRGVSLQIAGVDNSSYNNNFADFDKALMGLDNSNVTVLLCHDPSNWDKHIRRKTGVDLTLSGHTHGGQVGVELFGRYYSPVKMVYKQWAGLYTDREQHLYINRGLGTVGPSLRLAMPPEITLLTLRKPDNVA